MQTDVFLTTDNSVFIPRDFIDIMTEMTTRVFILRRMNKVNWGRLLI